MTRVGTNTEKGVGTNQMPPDQWKTGLVLSPHGVAINGRGDLFVAEFNTFGRVHRFNRSSLTSIPLIAQKHLQVVPPLQIQLVVHMVKVNLHRADADRELLGDLLVVETQRHQPHDLKLPRRQQVFQLGLDALPLLHTLARDRRR